MSPKIIIDPEFRDLIPPLAPQELENLHNSLCGVGCMSPLIVWEEENILVDGHNRYAWLTEHDRPFEVKEMSFSSRESAKRFIILNQLGRRNVTPETASKLRAEYEESMSKGRGGNRNPDGLGGRSGKALSKSQNETLTNTQTDTLAEVAQATGVSRATVARDVQLMEALDKLGIPRADYAAGKVLDAKGKKRSKKSIIDEAFPPKAKKAAPAPAASAPVEEVDDDTPLMQRITIEDEEDQQPQEPKPEPQLEPWTIILMQIPKITKQQRQELFEMLATKWDCGPVR